MKENMKNDKVSVIVNQIDKVARLLKEDGLNLTVGDVNSLNTTTFLSMLYDHGIQLNINKKGE